MVPECKINDDDRTPVYGAGALTETSDGPNVSPTQIGRFTKERVLSIGEQCKIQKRDD